MTQGQPRYPATYQEVRIIPQAVSVRYGLGVGARCVPLVLAMMYILGLSSPVPVPQLSLSLSQISTYRVAHR